LTAMKREVAVVGELALVTGHNQGKLELFM
jgi:hypothetical protein